MSKVRGSIQVIGEVIRKEFYQIRQDRRMLIVSFLAPVLQVVILGYAATTDVKDAKMVVCDLDRTSTSRELIREFTTSGYFVHRYSVERLSEIDPAIQRGNASIALVIPLGFGRSVMGRERAQVQVFLDGTDANTANILLGYATQILAAYSQSIVPSFASVQAGRVPRIIPEPRIWFNPDLRSAHFMVPGVVALVLMIITMTLTALGVVKEKEIGTLEQLMVTPMRPYELIIGKLVPFVIIGFIDVLFVIAVAQFWFGVPLRGSVLLLFALSGLFILTTLGLGLFISTIAKSQQQAMMIAQFMFFMPFLFLSGFAIPVKNMPIVIQYLSYIIPLRYFLEIDRAIFLKGSTINELWSQALALLIIGVTTLTLSVLRFHKKLE